MSGLGSFWSLTQKEFKRSLLLIDHFSGEAKKLLEKLGTDLLMIPGGLTGKLQPLDVYINKPLKQYMAEEYEEFLTQDCTSNGPEGPSRTPKN